MPELRLSFPGLPECPEHHLSVDGMTPEGPNLSHWPGNRTPFAWKADLSTGICLRYARASEQEKVAFLEGASAVVNDHYDTDGFGSLLAVLRPEVAFAHEETLLAAATTGDFGVLTTERAFAIDRIVANLAAPHSRLAREFAGLAYPTRCLARYRYLLAESEAILAGRLVLEELWRDEFARIEAEVLAARGGDLERVLHHRAGLAVLTTKRPTARMTLNTLAAAHRVLHVVLSREGPLYRYHDRTETWFELVTIAPPRRIDLRPLAAHLALLEASAGKTAGTWCADAPTEPIPELWHGEPSAQEYGAVTRVLTPSALAPELVERAFLEFFS